MNIKYVNEVIELLRKYNGKILKFNTENYLESQRFKFVSNGCKCIADITVNSYTLSDSKLIINVTTYGCITDDRYMQIVKIGNSAYEKIREELLAIDKLYNKYLYIVCIPINIEEEPKYMIEVLTDTEYDVIIKTLDLIQDDKTRSKDILNNILTDKTIEI